MRSVFLSSLPGSSQHCKSSPVTLENFYGKLKLLTGQPSELRGDLPEHLIADACPTTFSSEKPLVKGMFRLSSTVFARASTCVQGVKCHFIMLLGRYHSSAFRFEGRGRGNSWFNSAMCKGLCNMETTISDGWEKRYAKHRVPDH